MASEHKITDLPDLISDLSPEDRILADRIFEVSTTTGRLDPPEAMYAWIEKSFGSVDHVTAQRIVKVTNRITLEGTLFNELRASRPLDTGVSLDLDREIAATEGDPFCHPKEGTPADVFGRLERRQVRRLPRCHRLRRSQPPPPHAREGRGLRLGRPGMGSQGPRSRS
jgi:hypothetical protein